MTTKTTTKMINMNNGKTIKVILERGTWEEEIRLDGQLCGYRTHLIDRSEIALWDGDKKLAYGEMLEPLPKQHNQLDQAIKAGCVGIVGREWFVKAETAEIIRRALVEAEAENPKTTEMITMEKEALARAQSRDRALEAEAAEIARRRRHPGWCEKCQSYCYGDCEA